MAQTNQNHTIDSEEFHNPWLNLLEDIFFKPHYAFESFLNRDDMGGRDLWKFHILLSLFAPISKFFSNLTIAIYNLLLSRESISFSDLSSGTISIWLFYVACIFFIRFADIFRIYFKRWNRTENWNPPIPWILMIGFLPFTCSGIFFFLPTPFNLGIMILAFIYSLHLSYKAFQDILGWTSSDFFSYLLQVGIFFLFIGIIFTGTYNIFRMLFL